MYSTKQVSGGGRTMCAQRGRESKSRVSDCAQGLGGLSVFISYIIDIACL